MEFMKAREAEVYAVLRIVTGFLFQWHGMGKLFGFPEPMPPGVPAFIVWIAGPIEFFGGLLVMIGLFTRPVAFLASGLMAFAYWMGHGLTGVPAATSQGMLAVFKALLPAVNKGELAILYCFVFLYMSARGSGIWSVDRA